MRSFTNGALWGGGSAGVASRVKANQWVPGFASVEKLAETSVVRNGVTNLASDSLAGGFSSAGMYLSAPPERYGEKTLKAAGDEFIKGATPGGLKSASKSAAPAVKEGGLKAVDFAVSPVRDIQNISRLLNN